MQFVTFELTHESFYCPVTGVCLQHEDVDKRSSTDPLEHPPCQAFWVDEVIGDCMSPEIFKDSAFETPEKNGRRALAKMDGMLMISGTS